MWNIAILIFKNGEWFPLPLIEASCTTKAEARKRALAIIRFADEQGLDPRQYAVFSFDEHDFEMVVPPR